MLKPAAYALGVVLALVGLVPLGLGARRVRTRFFPSLAGAIGLLGDATVGLALLFGTLQLLGAIGLFRRWSIVGALFVVGVAPLVVVRRPSPAERPADEEGTAQGPPVARWQLVACVVAVGILAAEWSTRIAASYATGISDHDSLWYHLPFAARFFRQGWVTRLPPISPDFPTMFHPANNELLHGMGMALFRRDLISPLLNVAWLGLALLAAWCAGQTRGMGPAALLAMVAALATPELAFTQAGSAGNDAAVLCLLAIAVAFLVHGVESRPHLVLAGLAAGMAMSVKLTALAPAGGLTIAVFVLAGRGRRRRAAVDWAVPLALTGSFWYLRNLIRAGSPIPSLHLGIGRFSLPHPFFPDVDTRGFAISHYLGDGPVIRHYLLPGVREGFGPVWWLLLAIVVAGVAVAVVRGSRLERALAIVALVAVAAYVVMPTSAIGPEGKPVLFYLTTRYAFWSIWLGMALLARVLSGRRSAAVVVATLFVAIAATQTAGGNTPAWAGGHRTIAFAVGLLVAAAGSLAIFRPHIVWPRLAGAALAGTAVVAVAAASVGYFVQRRYYRDRYHEPVYAWAQTLRHTNIGVVGFHLEYAFYGADLSNHVQYVGRPEAHGGFAPISSCPAWRRALTASHDSYLISIPTGFDETAPSYAAERWTTSDPAASVVLQLRQPPTTVFRLQARHDATGCTS